MGDGALAPAAGTLSAVSRCLVSVIATVLRNEANREPAT